MKISKALDIVYQLAEQNALPISDGFNHDSELDEQRAEQHEALDMVHDFIVNQMAEDEEFDEHYSMYADLVNFVENIEASATQLMTNLRKLREAGDVELSSHSHKG